MRLKRIDTDNGDVISYFQRSRAIKALLILFKNKNSGLDEILELIGGSKATGMKRLKELKNLELLQKMISDVENKKVYYRLTKKGEFIAKRLDELFEEIKNG